MEVTRYSPNEYALVRTDNQNQRLPPIRSTDLISK